MPKESLKKSRRAPLGDDLSDSSCNQDDLQAQCIAEDESSQHDSECTELHLSSTSRAHEPKLSASLLEVVQGLLEVGNVALAEQRVSSSHGPCTVCVAC